MIARLLCAGAFAACAALPAAAASDPLASAWDAAAPVGAITDEQAARINVVAYHGAVASLCDGFPLDEAEVAEVTNAILQANPEGLTAEELLARHVDILIGIGTARGLFLAEGSLQTERFCARAQETRDLPDFDDLWAD
jgi:hypothetical protein